MTARTLILAALLVAVAGPAAADPVSAAIASGVAAFKAVAATKIGAFLIQTAVGIGLSLLGQQRQRGLEDTGIRVQGTTAGGTAPQGTILGLYADGGHLEYRNSWGDNDKRLVEVVSFSDLPGVELSRVIIEGEYSDLGPEESGRGNVILAKNRAPDRTRAWVKWYDGSQTAADPELVTRFGADPDRPWTADHKLSGVGYAIFTYYFDRKVFRSGVPRPRLELLGIPVYDPREDVAHGGTQTWDNKASWTRSFNPIVLVYNILRGIELPDGSVWGGGVAAEDLPESVWFAEMNKCDATVGDPPRPRYRAGIRVDFTRPPFEYVGKLLAAAGAQIAELGGVWYVRAGAPGTPVTSFSDDDVLISEAREYAPFPGLEQTHNGVAITYPSPAALWNPRELPPLIDAGFEQEDGRRRLATLELEAVPWAPQARQLAHDVLRDDRRFRRHVLRMPPEFFFLRPLQTAAWTSAWNGYTGKTFEASEVAYDLRRLVATWSLRERDPNDWVHTPAYETPEPPAATTPPPRPDAGVPAWAAEGVTIDDADGPRRPALRLSWDAGAIDGTVAGISWEVRDAGTLKPILSGSTADVQAGELYLAGDLLPGRTVEARAKALSNVRETVWGAWASAALADVRDLPPTVRITTTAQNFAYTAEGALKGPPVPQGATITAVGWNVPATPTPWYEFSILGADGLERDNQTDTAASYTYAPPATVAEAGSEVVTVRIREGGPAGTILAEDTEHFLLLKDTAGAAALRASLSNGRQDVPAAPDGSAPDLSQTATNVYLYLGTATLPFRAGSNPTWDFAGPAVLSTGLSGDTTANDEGTFASFGVLTGMSGDSGTRTFTIVGTDADGNAFGPFDVVQSFAKVKTGEKGAPGDNGTNGAPKPRTPLTISKASDGTYSASYVDIDFEFRRDGSLLSRETVRVSRVGDSWSSSPGYPGTADYNDSQQSSSIEVDGKSAVVTATHSPSGATAVASVAIVLDGSPGGAYAEARIYRETAGTPATPGSGGEYDFDTGQTTAAPTLWSVSPPSNPSNPVWTSVAMAYSADGTGTAAGLTWSTPVRISGADGKGGHVARLFRRQSTQPSTPTGGTFDFDTMSFTARPFGWEEDIPTGTDPLWVTEATFTNVGGGGTASPEGGWKEPVRIEGSPGAPGKSSYQARVLKRSATPLGAGDEPSGGEYDFDTGDLTPPTGWSIDVPAGTDPVYAARYLFTTPGDTATVTAGTWSTPTEYVKDGADGLSTYTVSIYKRLPGRPSTPDPTGASYNFGTETITPPDVGDWTVEVPDSNGDPLWVSEAKAVIEGTSGVAASLNFGEPRKVAEDGADGVTGFVLPLEPLTISKAADGTYSDTGVIVEFEFRRNTTVLSRERVRINRSGDSWSTTPTYNTTNGLNRGDQSTSVNVNGKTAVATATHAPTGATVSITVNIAIDGEQGPQGPQGPKPPGTYWVRTTAYTLPVSYFSADNIWNNASYGPGVAPAVGDIMVAYNGNGPDAATAQQFFRCTNVTSETNHSWVAIDHLFRGNVMIPGTLQITDDLGNVIFSSGVNLDWSRVTGAGAMADIDKITEANKGTFIDAAVVLDAYIQNLTANRIKLLSGTGGGNLVADAQGRLVVGPNAIAPDQVYRGILTDFDEDYRDVYLSGDGGYQNRGTVQITVPSGEKRDVLLMWGLDQAYDQGSGPLWGYRISNGSFDLISRIGMAQRDDYPGSMFWDRDLGPGTETYYLGWKGEPNGASIEAKGWLIALAFKTP